MKQSAHTRKANEAVKEALAKVLLVGVSDPRLGNVTVGGVEVSPDRRVAKAFMIVDDAHADEVLAGLQSAKGRIRSLLSQELGWRYTPELRFGMDTTLDEADNIRKALKHVPPTLAIAKDDHGYPLPEAGTCKE